MGTRFRFLWVLLLSLSLLAGCTATTPIVLSGGPKPPMLDPNLLGRPNRNIQFITDLAALQACIDAGASAFGATLQTTNVRSAADIDACRVGRLARGALVEIVGYTSVEPVTQAATPALNLPTPTPIPQAPLGPQVGYVEDIQPLFERSCSACLARRRARWGCRQPPTAIDGRQPQWAVVTPGDPEASKLWQMVGAGKMPLTGPLPPAQQRIVYAWIKEGAAERRASKPSPQVAASAPPNNAASAPVASTWLTIGPGAELDAVPDACEAASDLATLVSSDLILPVSCGAIPNEADLAGILSKVGLRPAVAASNQASSGQAGGGQTAATTASSQTTDADATTATTADAGTSLETEDEVQVAAAPAAPAAAAPRVGATVAAGAAGIRAAALGVPAATEDDPYMTPRGGFCLDRRLPNNERGITAITFAPDGRMFLALDSSLTGEVDPLILYDAYHPSRSVATYDWVNNNTKYEEIFVESTRITGMDYADGALYLSRAGEVGRIPDGGGYEKLADGFAVQSQLFHANNGIVISNGWVYVSAGGVRDGYVEGPIVGIGEDGAQQIVSGGNPYAARIVRAPLGDLLGQRSIAAFSTAARGVRNPYGITSDPAGRIWFTDNGATNVPDEISAGDEVNLLDPGAIGGGESATPYFGFPLALSGAPPDWYTGPVAALVNSAAPTGITWAYDTIYFGVYGRYPGLYRLGRNADGAVIPERILHGWPVLAVTTAPDGAIWIGLGNGGLYRITPGCSN
ncbi:MAG: hypothetical protein IPM07_10220 [Anaerolineales bacterium]|nr:hypothetical protein [Anaerolineales bacterium]